MSSFLHHLVHSLSMREKIYFRRYSKIHGDGKNKVYLKLYETLEKQPVYNEKAFLNSMGKSNSQQLVPYNRYLADQILKSLVNCHWNKSSAQKLNKQIAFIDILSRKGFRKEALKRLKKAKKEAYEKEEFSFVLELIQLEIDLLFQHGILNFTKQLNKLQKESELLIEKINNFHQLRLLKEQIRELQFLNIYIYLSHPEQFHHLLEHPLLTNSTAALSKRAKEVWHYIQVLKYYLLREFDVFFEAGKQYLDFFNENQHLFPEKQKMTIFSNFLYAAAKTKKDKTFWKIYADFNHFYKTQETGHNYFIYISLVRRFCLAYETINKILSELIIKELKLKLDEENIPFNEVEIDMIAWNVVRACIDIGNFSEAQHWLVFWKKHVKIEHTQHLLRLLSMIIYYELDYFELLSSEVENTAKEWSRKKRIRAVERELLRFFRKIAKKKNQLIEKKEIKKLFSKLEIYKLDSHQNLIFEEFDLCRWISQRIERLELSFI